MFPSEDIRAYKSRQNHPKIGSFWAPIKFLTTVFKPVSLQNMCQSLADRRTISTGWSQSTTRSQLCACQRSSNFGRTNDIFV